MNGYTPRNRAGRLLGFLVPLTLALGCTPPGGGPGPAGGAGGANFPFDWPFQGRDPVATGQQAMVVTADARATEVGLDILSAGGNAVDAAVATGFALAVVHPTAGNIGGGGFLVVRTAEGEVATLDYRETAPLRLTPDHYLDARGEPTDASLIGHLASGVPGSVAGLAEAHRRFGSMAWEELIAPAIDLAANGFTVTAGLNEVLIAKQEALTRFPETERIFYPGDEPLAVGSTFRQPQLAETLREIAREGKDAFYRGRIADLIVREMRAGNGLITREDLSRYAAKWRDPIQFEYDGNTVISMPPPSSGGVTLALILNMLEGYDLARLGWNTPETTHLIAESFRRAFADRNYHLGDPDHVEMPIQQLVSQDYADELRASISRSRASSSEAFNRVPVLREGANTTHYSILDGAGNAVAVTTTLNSSFGSGVVVRGGGFFLNNEMDDFTVRAGFPNQFGLIQGRANLVGPGRRPLSAMTPTIVVDSAGTTRLILGSPGGPKIITAVAQVVLNVLEFGMDVRMAVSAPRIHHQLYPDEIMMELSGLDAVTMGTLISMGHEVDPTGDFFGNVNAIQIGPAGTRYGFADPRREGGRALGY